MTSVKNVQVFKLLDIGDIIGREGFVVRTKLGEISVHASSFELYKTIQAAAVLRKRLPHQVEKI